MYTSKFERIINKLSVPIIIFNSSGKLIAANKKFSRILGYKISELYALSLFDLEQEIKSNPFNNLLSLLRTKEHVAIWGILKKKNEEPLTTKYKICTFSYKGHTYYVAVVIDSAQHKNLVYSMGRRIKFERALRLISQQLNTATNIDSTINSILASLGTCAQVDRCFLFKKIPGTAIFVETNAWGSKNIKTPIKGLEKIDARKYPALFNALKINKRIEIENFNALPQNDNNLRLLLKHNNLKSIIIIPMFMQDKIIGCLGFAKVSNQEQWQPGDRSLLETASNLITNKLTQIEHEKIEKEQKVFLEVLLIKTIQAIENMTEQRDLYTSGHQSRVAKFALAIAQQMQLDEHDKIGIYLGALIHDIGKVHLPFEILNAPRKLTPAEYEIVKEHPVRGHEIIKDIPFIWPVAEIILYHHERINGSGYPFGLKGNKIPLVARIVAVADVFDAMTSRRPYRPTNSHQSAFKELKQNAGILYDKEVVKYFIKSMNS